MMNFNKKSPRFYGGVFGFFAGIITTIASFWMIYDSHNNALADYAKIGEVSNLMIDPFPFRVFESMVSGKRIEPIFEKDKIVFVKVYQDTH